ATARGSAEQRDSSSLRRRLDVDDDACAGLEPTSERRLHRGIVGIKAPEVRIGIERQHLRHSTIRFARAKQRKRRRAVLEDPNAADLARAVLLTGAAASEARHHGTERIAASA